MDLPDIDILYEDNHLLAAYKPAGMLVQGDKTGDESLLDRVREWLRIKYQKPGNVFCGLVHRLDRPSSGVIIFAKTSKAAKRLCEEFRNHTPEKIYRAVVLGKPYPLTGKLSHLLVPGREGRASRIVQAGKRAQVAILSYRTLHRGKKLSELEIRLETGRKHQIRAQLAHLGCPLAGDLKYGAREPLCAGAAIALHAERISLPHPTRKEIITCRAPLPGYWPKV